MNAGFKFIGMDFLVLSQSILFAILFAIWSLPHTIFTRNVCLVLGCCIGVYQIYAYRTFLANKKAIPIYLLLGLFIWATIHLLFLSNDFALQYAEYQSIWKRSLLGAIFALGFGLGITNASPGMAQRVWIIFYLGLLLPTLIYIFRFGLIHYEKTSGISIGAYWHIYIAKTEYVAFCIPVLAVSLGQIYYQAAKGKWLSWANLVYLCAISSVLYVFYAENIKNGVLYSLIFILIFIGLITYRYFKIDPLKIGILVVSVILGATIFIQHHIDANNSWRTFFADARVAIKVDHIDAWRVCRSEPPKNDMGIQVSDTNYSRIAWGISALKLVAQHPLGYGLVERSFGHLGKKIWPESCLTQSHSGWLDLALGIGVPGMILVLGAFLFSLRLLKKIPLGSAASLSPWVAMAFSVLLCFLLIWCTTEISQKIYFEELLFFLAFSGAIAIVSASTNQISLLE